MLASSGRGGAGNMVDSSKSPKVNPQDLETPTLKTSVVTTGRGGSGNMAKNDNPAETRKRQDVDAVPRRLSAGASHYGRGGAANVFNASEEEAAIARKTAAIADDDSSSARDSNAETSLAAKGKQWLFGKKA